MSAEGTIAVPHEEEPLRTFTVEGVHRSLRPAPVALNRAQRRHAKRLGLVKPVDCIMPRDSDMHEGAIFTVAGRQLTPDGWIDNCKRGEETPLRAVFSRYVK